MDERRSSDTHLGDVVVIDGGCRLGREAIGGKAWGINRMRALGLPVPPAIVITTHACDDYFRRGKVVDERLWAQVVEHMRVLEEGAGRRFGAAPRPLLVSVRSGAPHSMPGMMDTVLDLGLNDALEAALAAEHGQSRHAADTHRRFRAQYRKVVLGGRDDSIPDDPWAQLRAAVTAVFESWHSPRAQVYRRERGLPQDGCTAVIIQAMVFGNADAHSGTGVLFSRNPLTGDPPPWGEWLAGGQGEDVVSGNHTPQPLEALRSQMPEVHAQLMRATAVLEADAGDIQDIEFTVESGHLWLLQSRIAKRSAHAAMRAAVAFAQEGLITREAALRRLSSAQLRQLPRLRLGPAVDGVAPVARGEAASPGVAQGVVVLDAQAAESRSRLGESVILARPNTSPEDLPGVVAASGVLTEQGGSTSHAAVICRELGRPCVVGCGMDTVTSLAGQQVTLDGGSGQVWLGERAVDCLEDSGGGDAHTLLEWGLPLISMRLLRPADAPAQAVDLNAHGESWPSALAPGAIVRGAVLDTDAGIVAALRAGVAAAVVERRLPALLACLDDAAARADPAPGVSDKPQESPIDALTLLRLVALKGRATPTLLAEALDIAPAAADERYDALCKRGLCARSGGQFVLALAGREHLAGLLAHERAGVNAAAMLAAYEDFSVLDAQLKQLLTQWQVKPGGALNDHTDSHYDAGVIERLLALHARAAAFLARGAGIVPRLAHYRVRLSRAAARIAAGERTYVAKITADSYHSIWFELHEELIGLLGMTRESLARNASARAG